MARRDPNCCPQDYGLNISDSSSGEDDPLLVEKMIAEGSADGIPRACVCGSGMILQREPNGPHKGRRYYACCETRPGPHFRRWWDDAITQEVMFMKTENREQKERIQQLESDVLKKNHEIEELKIRIVKLERLS